MKIAILCCGQLRSFLKCKDFIEKHVLSKNDCSLFVYTDTEIASKNSIRWDGKTYNLPKKGIEDLYEDAVSEIKKLVYKYSCNDLNQNKEQDALDRIKIEPHFKVNTPNWWDNSIGSFEGVYFNCFNREQCFDLLQKYINKYNFKFDYVLYIRPDIKFLEDLNINEEILKLSELKVENKLKNSDFVVMYSPLKETSSIDMTIRSSTLSRNAASDTVYWSSLETMTKLISNFSENIFCSLQEIKDTNIFCFESALWLSMHKQGISRYVMYKDYSIERLVNSKIRFSEILKVRIKKTSTRVFLLRFLKIRTLMIAIVIFGYPIYLQIFSDKYVKIENWYERERR